MLAYACVQKSSFKSSLTYLLHLLKLNISQIDPPTVCFTAQQCPLKILILNKILENRSHFSQTIRMKANTDDEIHPYLQFVSRAFGSLKKSAQRLRSSKLKLYWAAMICAHFYSLRDKNYLPDLALQSTRDISQVIRIVLLMPRIPRKPLIGRYLLNNQYVIRIKPRHIQQQCKEKNKQGV